MYTLGIYEGQQACEGSSDFYIVTSSLIVQEDAGVYLRSISCVLLPLLLVLVAQ